MLKSCVTEGVFLAQLMNLFGSEVSGLKTSVPSKCDFLFSLLMNQVLGTIFQTGAVLNHN